MGTVQYFRKFMAITLSTLLLSCNVYQKTPVSLDDALNTQKHVKVTTIENNDYEFRRLEKREDQLLGVTRKSSATANRLKNEPAIKEGKIWKFELKEDNIEFVFYRDEFQTKMVKIGIPVMLFGALIFAFVEGAGELSGDWHRPGETQIQTSVK